MVRRYCSQHLPLSDYQQQIESVTVVTDGGYLLFKDVTITNANDAPDADAFMASLGWVLSGVDPVNPIPDLILTSPDGSTWQLSVDNAGVFTVTAWSP
jgi:hypothetical protein